MTTEIYDKLKKLEEEKINIIHQIKEIEDAEKIEKLKKTEELYLGHCYENEDVIFKVMCAAASNEYRVGVIGFQKEPILTNEQDIFDENFHRHPFQGRTTLDFVIEDDIMIRNLKSYTEITQEEFEEKLKKITEKLIEEMKIVYKLEK